MDFWKNPHKSNEPVKDRQEEAKATNFNNFSCLAGMQINNKIPKIGNSKIYTSKFFI